MKQIQFCSIFIFLLFFATTQIHSQVKIGNNIAPVEGALLELSNASEGETTSTKGLSLPRVQLISPTELYPMFSDTDEAYDTDEKRKVQKANHTGLLVYVPNVFSDNYCPGLYMWDGSKWTPFQQKISADQKTFTDGEGNTYTYAHFGDLDWMTQNVRSLTEYGSGDESKLLSDVRGIISSSGVLSSPGIGVNTGSGNIPYIFNKKSDIIGKQNNYIMNGDLIESTLEAFIEKMGLLYRYPQAQKACPQGWRLPTEAEMLSMYSYVQAQTGLDEENAGTAMKNDRSTYANTDNPNSELSWDGVDICNPNSINVGFNAMPNGGINEGENVNDDTYGNSTFYWFDQGDDYPNIDRVNRYAIKWNSNKLEKTAPNGSSIVWITINGGYSARCVK